MALAGNKTVSQEPFLVIRSVHGDLEAFNQLVIQYQNLAYNHAFAILGDPMLAEDATQESFIKAFQNIRALRTNAFRAWLLRIVTNTSISLLRTHLRHRGHPLTIENDNGDESDSAPWMADPAPSVETTVEHNEHFKQVYQILDSLPSIYRTVLTMIDMYDMDYAEAAVILQVPIGTVKSRLSRARHRAKTKLLEEKELARKFFPHEPAASYFHQEFA